MSGESKPVHPSAGEVAEDGVEVVRDAGTDAKRTVVPRVPDKGGPMIQCRIGDEIEIVDADAVEDVRRATVIRFLSDEEQGMSPDGLPDVLYQRDC
jgi:hypothetical protein